MKKICFCKILLAIRHYNLRNLFRQNVAIGHWLLVVLSLLAALAAILLISRTFGKHGYQGNVFGDGECARIAGVAIAPIFKVVAAVGGCHNRDFSAIGKFAATSHRAPVGIVCAQCYRVFVVVIVFFAACKHKCSRKASRQPEF
ncbi:MAG: hypothetical protein IKO46_03830 [Salinivirgaceae bacterium]|nr:hypothetical protein [Salinivirgaceae bacterium]MBR6082482.1 hypothetical protein [Salinivirgaceae bacterium]